MSSSSCPSPSLIDHLSALSDPRIDRTKHHKLVDVLVTAICAVVAGADTWEDIADFGFAKAAWLRTFLEMPRGPASAATYARVMQRLDPQAFEGSLLNWVRALGEEITGAVAIDGKRVRGCRGVNATPLHVVSAWSSEARLVLGQIKTEEKSNEITAIPALLEQLSLKGCIVSIDAQGCQKTIARQIRQQGGDYVLALKSNHGNLHHEVKGLFEIRLENNFAHHPNYGYHETQDQGHGCQERRQYYVVEVPDWLAEDTAKWQDLRCLGLVRSERRVGDKVQYQDRYYLTSLPCEARAFAEAVRGHWEIENNVHWVLDVTFHEDASRVRKGHAPANLSAMRRMALNLVRGDPTKGSLKRKRKRAGWNEQYLFYLLKTQLLGPQISHGEKMQ